MSDLSTEFRSHARTPVVYEGVEGYRRMMSEIRESLYRDIPEARGRIEFFDFSNDREEEYERIFRSFGTTLDDYLASTRGDRQRWLKSMADNFATGSGEAMPFIIEGREVSIGFGVDIKGWDLTNDFLRAEARRTIHEAFHGLDHLFFPERILRRDPPEGNDYVAYARVYESFAEIGSTDLLARNGDRSIVPELAALYQINIGASREDEMGISRYDHADGYRMLQQSNHYGNSPDQVYDFNLTGWRESLHMASDIRSRMDTLSAEAVLIERPQAYIISDARAHFIDSVTDKMKPYEEALQRDLGMDVRGASEQLMTRYTERTFPFHQYSGETAEAATHLFSAQHEFRNWLQERTYMPSASRVLNGYDLIEGTTTDVVGSGGARGASLDQMMGQAALQWMQTGSELDRTAFIEFARAADERAILISPEARMFHSDSMREAMNKDPEIIPREARRLNHDSMISRLGFAERIESSDMMRAYRREMEQLAGGKSYDDAFRTGGYETSVEDLMDFRTNKAAPITAPLR